MFLAYEKGFSNARCEPKRLTFGISRGRLVSRVIFSPFFSSTTGYEVVNVQFDIV